MIASYKFNFTAGIIIRSNVVGFIKDIAFMYDLECSLDEDKNWLDSNYRVKLIGKSDKLTQAVKRINNYFEALDDN